MGWSARTEAFATLHAMRDRCLRQTGTQNSWVAPDGSAYFFEPDHREHDDGRITGRVFALVGVDDAATGSAATCTPAGVFAIAPEGGLVEAPAHLRGLMATN
jgi:hypothetical protein